MTHLAQELGLPPSKTTRIFFGREDRLRKASLRLLIEALYDGARRVGVAA